MLQTIINPTLIAFTLFTTTGVLVHDTQVDRAASLALALPSALALYGATDKFADSAHTHVERVHGPNKHVTPRLQPRDDDVRYFTNKRVAFGGNDATSLWPST